MPYTTFKLVGGKWDQSTFRVWRESEDDKFPDTIRLDDNESYALVTKQIVVYECLRQEPIED
jgi:hypothetical protein